MLINIYLLYYITKLMQQPCQTVHNFFPTKNPVIPGFVYDILFYESECSYQG